MPAKDSPFTPLGLQPSFGFGDRTGLATPDHIKAMRRAGAGLAPIFAQQSIRGLTRSGRTPQAVIDAAVTDMSPNWKGPRGTDTYAEFLANHFEKHLRALTFTL